MQAYLDLIKPGETSFLTFTGVSAALIAAGGKPSLYLLPWILLALIAGSAAVNGLTNYIDREFFLFFFLPLQSRCILSADSACFIWG